MTHIIADKSREQEHLWSTSPEWLSPVVNQVMEELEIQHKLLSTENFWGYFDLVLARIKELSTLSLKTLYGTLSLIRHFSEFVCAHVCSSHPVFYEENLKFTFIRAQQHLWREMYISKIYL